MRKRIVFVMRSKAPRVTQWLLRLFPRLSRRKILATHSDRAEGTWSSRRLNFITNANPSFTRYLEIGIQSGNTLEAVLMPVRVGVDPNPLMNLSILPQGVRVLPVTSDEFFDSYAGPNFDLVFLDGLHEWFQTYRDILNSLNFLSDGGVILVDDVVPSDAISAVTPM